MNSEQKSHIIATLKIIQDKPLMFIAEGTPAIVNFFLGFDLALKVLSKHRLDDELYSQILLERGWGQNTIEAINTMQDKGLTDENITKEIINIRIAVLQRQSW